ncbi:MAG TPA: MBL fold metallo-hydrolase [Ruminococcaceae bacterium]|nr:MBL fold metallo-hydrolase [Oscillospiraceae bacterium]
MARKKRVTVSFMIIFVLALLAGIGITLSPYLGLREYIPAWSDIFKSAGISAYIPEGTAKNRVHFIDVGQADCMLIQSGEHAALIDAGNNADSLLVTDYLKNAGVEKLELAVATHAHEDHIGGMAAVVDSFEIETLLMQKSPPGSESDTKTYENLLEAVADKNQNVELPEPGKSYAVGDFTLTVAGPFEEFEDENDRSIIIKAVAEDVSFLFMGDAEKGAELSLIENRADLDADILKVGHHGSNSSSTKEFLWTAKPSYAVIMVGRNNRYNHPGTDALDRIGKLEIPVYRTDASGTVVVSVQEGQVHFETEY